MSKMSSFSPAIPAMALLCLPLGVHAVLAF
jgi:hypothetical protein